MGRWVKPAGAQGSEATTVVESPGIVGAGRGPPAGLLRRCAFFSGRRYGGRRNRIGVANRE